MSAIHLNLLDTAEQQRSHVSASGRVAFMVLGGVIFLASLVWGCFVGVQLSVCKDKLADVRTAVARLAKQSAESSRLKAKLNDQQAEADQYAFYCRGRQERGELLKRLAFAIPEGVSLTTLTIPPPPKQVVKRPSNPKLLPSQGPTQTVERVELRLAGRAAGEADVFQMMRALEGNAFTGLVAIVKQPAAGGRESPRVLAFRQDSPSTGTRDIVFDIVYDITPREFVK